MILHRYRFPLGRTHLPPLLQSCQPGSCSPWWWRCNTASEQFCKGSRRSSVHWHSEDIRMQYKKPQGCQIHSTSHTFELSLTCLNTNIIQLVPMTFAGYFFFSHFSWKALIKAQEIKCWGHCLSKSGQQYPLQLIYTCIKVLHPYTLLLRSHQKVSETDKPFP